MLLVIALVITLIILSGCSESTESKPEPPSTSPSGIAYSNDSYKVEIYYYYDPECPNCIAIAPYMEFIRAHIPAQFDFCDLTEPDTCTNTSKSLLALAIRSLNISPAVPMVIVKSEDEARVLIGRNKISTLDTILSEKYGIPSPIFRYGNVEYRLNDCIQCHKVRNLPIPSRYECTSCCHDVDFQIEIVDPDLKFKME